MARSAMQLQLSLTPDAELPAVELPRVRTLVEIRLEDALNERVHYPFTMDARSIREHVEILVQLPEGVLRVLVTSERLFSSTTRSEEHTSELQSLMRISYAVFCLKKKKNKYQEYIHKTLNPMLL